MNSFISEVATSLYQQYGDDVSSLRIIFPSRRARLFFCDELAHIALRPTWQPRFESLGELMEQVAEIRCSDNIKLVTELYKVYAKYHKESFDSFYFWGEMLLSDFDQIDKYLIDADVLFSNIEDLHNIEDNFSYLTQEQIDIISKFWSNFSAGGGFSTEKEHFITIWRTLGAIYHEFRSTLADQGIAYEGMVHRLAAERITNGQAMLQLTDNEHYTIIGFNALSECEKRLFAWLQRGGKAEFYWDYDSYYVGNSDHEAGMFLRDNITNFTARKLPQTSFNHFTEQKNITVVSSPSDPLQCKHVYTFLQQLIDQGLDPGKETAIVLTDETLLLPVLHSIPEGIRKVNVTMGYPLRQTTAYSFMERLMELQKRKRTSKNGCFFHHADAIGLLNHPYILEFDAVTAGKIATSIEKAQSSYAHQTIFTGNDLISKLFTPIESWIEMAEYLRVALSDVGRNSAEFAEMGTVATERSASETTAILTSMTGSSAATTTSMTGSSATTIISTTDSTETEITPKTYTSRAPNSASAIPNSIQPTVTSRATNSDSKYLATSEDTKQRREFFSLIIDNIIRIENSLLDSNLEVTTAIFASLLRKVLQGVRVPYLGEPLDGIQIMGILETRNLDFENILILSVNDDTFPGNRATTSSFVPHNLRVAYGLPTPRHHEGVYAYYFYRLLQRASKIDIAYCSKSDEKQTGEPSRYIYQLQYESPHNIQSKSIPLNVNLSQNESIVIAKDGSVAIKLAEFLDNPERTLSPTSFYTYIECPLKFYFRNIARLNRPNEIEEGIDLPMFGTILHKAMESLYTPIVGQANPQKQIHALISSVSVENAVNQAIEAEYLKSTTDSPDQWSGNIILVRDIVSKYINGSILPYDSKLDTFIINSLEAKINTPFEFEVAGQTQTVTFAGMADRIDLLDGGITRIVDYKTGSQHREFTSIDALFSEQAAQRSSAVLQTLLYSLIVYKTSNYEVQPALYYVRFMNSPDFSPLLMEGKSEVKSFSTYKTEFEIKLRETLSHIFDLSTPFTQCSETKVCEFCDYRAICRR